MPWHVSKTDQCPTSKPWGVIKDSDGAIEGCHPTKQAALDHMAALYANEPGAKSMTMSDCAPCAEQRAGSPQHYRSNVDNSAWSATDAMSQCANSGTPASCYGEICAGKKAGDTSTQAAWALPHHYPGKGPNATGTRNALSRLPQTQGLTNKSAAQSHLEAHMKQINPDYTPSSQTPPASRGEAGLLRMRAYVEHGTGPQVPNGTARAQLFTGAIYRAKPVKLDGRSGDFYEVEGYASVVDTPYQMFDMFGPYDEIIRSGAFDLSLANPELDTAFLTNHRGITMARTTNQTLALWSDSTGLGARAYLNANRQDVRDLVSAIDDGLIDEMSFAFYLNAGGWNESYDVFTIFEADINRGDVSAVNYGANPYTSIAARATEILHELDHLPAGAARAAIVRLRARPDIGEPAIVPSVPVEIGRGGQMLDDDERASGGNPADATHGSYTGAHTHMHAANGAQGSDEMHTHAHSHNGDGNHGHGHANSADLPQWEADLLASKADEQFGDQGPGAVESGMSTEFAAQLLMLDDDHERDRENS